MRYTHHFHLIRKRKHALPISIIVLLLILSLIFILGFSQLSAIQFITGFTLSLIRVLIAYVIALVLGLILSLLVTKSEKIEEIGLPILDALQSFPAFSLLPLLLTVFHQSGLITIFLLVIAMIWPLVFTMLTGIKSEASELKEASTIFGATGYKRLVYITLPYIFPSIVTGSIVAWGEAWEAIIATEIITKIPGVGTYLALAGERKEPNVLIIGILLLLAILFIFNKFFWIPLLNRSTKYQQ